MVYSYILYIEHVYISIVLALALEHLAKGLQFKIINTNIFIEMLIMCVVLINTEGF